MTKAIPDRWTAYKSCGTVVEGTSFICFKVPLRKAVQQHRKEIREIWDIETLLAKVPGLGAVIDLTNTAKYYDPGALKSAGVRHKKILIPGREIPPETKVKEFTNAVDQFLKFNPGMIIGVHCTHGLNRTGYMVCRYMRDRMGIRAEDAIDKFETARGYHIERKNYIAHVLGEKPPPPDVGPHTEPVKPVKNKYRPSKQRFELSLPGKMNTVYPDKLKNCVSDTFTDDSSFTELKSRKVHSSYTSRESACKERTYPFYVKPGQVEQPRMKNCKSVNKPNCSSLSESRNVDLSWRIRSPNDDADSDFQNFGRHQPRESASAGETWRNVGSGSRKMYGRPSSQSAKYSFDYRYDY